MSHHVFTLSCRASSHFGRYSLPRPTEGRRLSWPGWLVTYCLKTVTHPCTNRPIVRRPGIELTTIESRVRRRHVTPIISHLSEGRQRLVDGGRLGQPLSSRLALADPLRPGKVTQGQRPGGHGARRLVQTANGDHEDEMRPWTGNRQTQRRQLYARVRRTRRLASTSPQV